VAIPLEPFPLYDVYNIRLLFHSHYFLYMFMYRQQTKSKKYSA